MGHVGHVVYFFPGLLNAVAGVNNKERSGGGGAAAALRMHLWERLRSSYNLQPLNFAPFGRTWGCSPSLCSGARVCVVFEVSRVTRGTVNARGFRFWHYPHARSDRRHCTNDLADSPPSSNVLSRFVFAVVIYTYPVACLLHSCLLIRDLQNNIILTSASL